MFLFFFLFSRGFCYFLVLFDLLKWSDFGLLEELNFGNLLNLARKIN